MNTLVICLIGFCSMLLVASTGFIIIELSNIMYIINTKQVVIQPTRIVFTPNGGVLRIATNQKAVYINNIVHIVHEDDDYFYTDSHNQFQSCSLDRIKKFNNKLAMCKTDKERIDYINEYSKNN